jgi:hypothetical protein
MSPALELVKQTTELPRNWAIPTLAVLEMDIAEAVMVILVEGVAWSHPRSALVAMRRSNLAAADC